MKSVFKTIASLVIAPSCAYTGFVAFQNTKKTYDENDFKVGSTNYMVIDSLQTGDIVLFSRKWYHYHIPVAIMIKTYQWLHSEYDHCGVVIVDNEGVPLLFENTPFGGRKLRRLDTRIMNSNSVYIGAIPLIPRENFSRQEQNLFLAYAKAQASESIEQKSTNELYEQYQLHWKLLVSFLVGSPSSKDESDALLPFCSNTKLLQDSLQTLGVRFSRGKPQKDLSASHQHAITLADVSSKGLLLVKESKHYVNDEGKNMGSGSDKSNLKIGSIGEVMTFGKRILLKTT